MSRTNKNADKILVKKVIRALLLLEGLVHNRIHFILKGEQHLNPTKRLSFDIDIILPEVPSDFDVRLVIIAIKLGFIRKEEQIRLAKTAISKKHYQFFYIPL